MTTKSEHIVRYTADEMKEMVARGESQTNWERVRALTSEEIEASIDHEDEGIFDPTQVYVGSSFDPAAMDDRANWRESVYLEAEIVDWFREHHPDDFRERINDVLRANIEAHQRKAF